MPTSTAPAPPTNQDAPSEGRTTVAVVEDPLQLSGRVRFGAALDDTTLQIGTSRAQQEKVELALSDARLGAEYRASELLSLTLKLDLVPRPQVKDAYLRLDSDGLRGQFGQFKMPVSAIALESAWSLPVTDRGMIDAVLANHVQMLGRRPGLLGRYRAKGKLRPELSLGLFQGQLGNSSSPLVPDFSEQKTLDSQNAVARLGARVLGVHVGLSGERISTVVGSSLRHFWATGVDAQADYTFSGQSVRFWLEGFTGTTWRAQGGGTTHPRIRFATTSGILAWRWGGQRLEDPYLEPFVLGALLDPDLDTRRDLLWQAMVGVGGGLWDRLRVTLQVEAAGSGEGVPDQLFVDAVVREHRAVELQIGAAF